MSKRARLIAAVAFGAALSAGIAAAQTVVVEPAPAPSPAGVPDPVQSAGSFDRLSIGNQKIARSLFEAQTVDPNGAAPLNLDQIAALKTGAPATTVSPGTTGTGWGNAFKQMQSQGLIDARNLGQVVSGHYAPPTATTSTAASSSGVVVTNGSGRSFVAGGKANGKAGVTTAAGSDEGRMTGVSNRKGSAKGPHAVATAGSSAGAGAGAAGGGAKAGGGKANGHAK